MFTKNQIKEIEALKDKKTRRETGLCIVEGAKFVEMARDHVEYIFTSDDVPNFENLVTTESPQDIACVAHIPKFEISDLFKYKTIIILDGIQDPGNLGAIFRLALAFDASLLLVDCADPSNTKVIRSSAGTFFKVPWVEVRTIDSEILDNIKSANYKLYRIEKVADALPIQTLNNSKKVALIFGNEGNGIRIDLDCQSLFIQHNNDIESLNVTHAVAIALFSRNK